MLSATGEIDIRVLSSTGFGAPRFETSSIARPNCSVVVTYFGATTFNKGSSGHNTQYKIR